MADPELSIDTPMLVAAIELVGRAGGREYEVGYLDDVADYKQARWWASALYRGTKVIVEGYPGPDHASEALARKLLDGGQCTHCTRRISLGATSRRTTPSPTRTCLWARHGERWERGCRHQVPEGQRAILRRPGSL